MILTKKIIIKFNPANKRHLESYGYKYMNNKEIEIPIEHLNIGSNHKVHVKCDVCGCEKEISYRKYLKNINNGNYYSCSTKCSSEKIKQTNIDNYGVEYCFQSENIKNKIKETNKKKYGVDNPSKSLLIKEKKKKTLIKSDYLKYKDFYSNEGLEILSIDKHNKNYKIKCNECQEIFEISYLLLKSRRYSKTEICTLCNPINKNISGMEIKLLNFIKNNYNNEIITNSLEIIENNELDIYLPELNLAFEFNGLYWHSELYRDKNYHKNKTDLCEEKGIQLIHIWEDDWRDKIDVVKSMILNKLNKTPNKIFARKCQIKEVNDNKLIKKFLNENHIQGFVGSSKKIGLYYNDELVSLMTFKKNNEEWDLNRFCNILNTNVIGGASKLLKYFIKNYDVKYIKTFSNRCYSNGKLYDKLGFVKKELQKADYSYIVDKKRFHKFNFRKDRNNIKKMTEHEFMFSQNIYRIYNCGLIKYELNIKF